LHYCSKKFYSEKCIVISLSRKNRTEKLKNSKKNRMKIKRYPECKASINGTDAWKIVSKYLIKISKTYKLVAPPRGH